MKDVKPTTTNRRVRYNDLLSLFCLVITTSSCNILLVSIAISHTLISNMSKRFSAADVASHKTANDLYIIVDEDVYDLTNFQEEHPGGKKSTLSLRSLRALLFDTS